MKGITIIGMMLLILLTACSNETVKEEKQKMKIAVIETSKGIIKAELYTEKAPITTENFIGLAN